MIVDGERLKALMSGAQQTVLLCSPFIKMGVLCTIFSVINQNVAVRVVTRWRAAEVAAGISDLGVFELVNDRPRTELMLLDDLHAKLFLADDKGLAGSANLTAAALGWSEKSNIELLLPVDRTTPDVARLLRCLDDARPATYVIRSEIEAEAAALSLARLDEGQDMSDEAQSASSRAWLPICATPEKLREIYEDPCTTTVVEGTREDGLADLRSLCIPSHLSPLRFTEVMRENLLLMPAIHRIVDRIPQGLTDVAGVALISEIRPDLTESGATLQWRIVRDWISEFFGDEFEVAPESFVIRLRHGKGRS